MTARLILLTFLALAAWGLSCRENRPDVDHRGASGTAQPAPEQVEARAVSPATDVFALGCILYECVTGRTPFPGATHAETLHNVVHGAYGTISRRRCQSCELRRPVV